MVTLRKFIEDRQGWDTHITQALEDVDFYKVTMCQVYDTRLAEIVQEWNMHCRTPGVNLAKYAGALEKELDYLCSLSFRPATIARLRTVRFLKGGYVDFLENLRLFRNHIKVVPNGDGTLRVRAKGTARFTTWFETHVIQILQELYFRDVHADLDLSEGLSRLDAKLARYRALSKQYPFSLSEFGGRRRASFAWHRYVLSRIIEEFGTHSSHFVGTSNVLLAVEMGTPFSGTMAHEFLTTGQAIKGVRLDCSQAHMLNLWQEVYRGDLGIALSDTVGFDAFLRDFDMFLAKLFDGMRHDSGDPFAWGDRAIEHYQSLRIDPLSRTLLFSDGLNVGLIEKLLGYFNGRARQAFGVGTDFTNDLGVKALQMVMKVVSVDGNPVAKISDSPGKGMCEDPAFESYLRKVYNIKETA